MTWIERLWNFLMAAFRGAPMKLIFMVAVVLLVGMAVFSAQQIAGSVLLQYFGLFVVLNFFACCFLKSIRMFFYPYTS